jgi:hypothetical protein
LRRAFANAAGLLEHGRDPRLFALRHLQGADLVRGGHDHVVHADHDALEVIGGGGPSAVPDRLLGPVARRVGLLPPLVHRRRLLLAATAPREQ